jgi:hypothetical protein
LELIEIIEEQAVFGFSGKINVLQTENSQYLGAIYQENGIIVHAQFRGLIGKHSLFQIILKQMNKNVTFKYVIEPEIITDKTRSFSINVDQLKVEAGRLFEEYLKCAKLRPPDSLQLMVSTDFLESHQDITPVEFDVLAAISDFCSVGEIYNSAKLYDFEITKALVSLRKKGGIKVLAK